MNKKNEIFKYAQKEELHFIKKNMPRGMIALVCFRTKKERWKVLYQLNQTPEKQDEEIIIALREIFFAVTQLTYNK